MNPKPDQVILKRHKTRFDIIDVGVEQQPQLPVSDNNQMILDSISKVKSSVRSEKIESMDEISKDLISIISGKSEKKLVK